MSSIPKPRPLPRPFARPTTPKVEQDAKAMPPPPVPPDSLAPILEPEVSSLARSFKNAVVMTGQIYGFYADTRKLGIKSYVTDPPRSLTTSFGREIEKYDQLCDAVESHLLRAIAVLQRDLFREEMRVKALEERLAAEQIARQKLLSSQSELPPVIEAPAPLPAEQQPASSQPTARSSPSISVARRPSAISISSLNRPAFPLKLDLSATSLRFTAEEASMFSEGLASPVTLAPKSARAVGPNEFPPELMEAFANASAMAENQRVDIDLTMPGIDDGQKLVTNASAGDSSDKPIELDLDSMDIDMTSMTDLFGDDAVSPDLNTNVDDLFSSANAHSDSAKGPSVVAQHKENENNYLQNLEAEPNNDIFGSFGSSTDSKMHSSQSPQVSDMPAAGQSVPEAGSLLEPFPSSSQLNMLESSMNSSGNDAPFDLNSIDLSNLDAGFFSGSSENGMSFPMDMDEFLNMGSMGEDKGYAGESRPGPT